MGSRRISNYASKPSSCLIYVCCHGGLLIALNLASNFGRTIFGWVGPVLASKTSPAGPNYVDQTWSGRTDFFPGPIFRYSTTRTHFCVSMASQLQSFNRYSLICGLDWTCGLDHRAVKIVCGLSAWLAIYRLGIRSYNRHCLKFYMKPEFWYTNSWHTTTAEI